MSLDFDQIQEDANEAIRLLKHANHVAGGNRVGSQEAIASLARISGLVDHIKFLDKYLKIGEDYENR